MAALVSIVTRTLGRPCLAEAAASVAAQTYRPLEWLVVDAAGDGLDVPGMDGITVRVAGRGERLRRSRAANVGLDEARGARLLVLDDDDLLRPAAVERLAAALDANPSHRVAYADVALWESGDHPVGRFASEYSELLLARGNLFPPNAALFDAALVRDAGERFDVALDWYEDWDFWLRLARHTPFLHLRETLADYRQHLSQSGIAQMEAPGADPRIRAQHTLVFERWAARRTALAERHEQLKRDAAAHEAAGRWPNAAQLWMQAHLSYPYDAAPIVAYASLAARAGDLRAALDTLGRGLTLMPGDPSLASAHAALAARLR